jgi:hypothetical protein
MPIAVHPYCEMPFVSYTLKRLEGSGVSLVEPFKKCIWKGEEKFSSKIANASRHYAC